MSKFCINCGLPVEDDQSFCPSCSASNSVLDKKGATENFLISVINPISETKHKFQVNDNVKINTIINKVIAKDNLPQTDASGNMIEYSLSYDVNNIAIEDSLTLKDATIKANDILYIAKKQTDNIYNKVTSTNCKDSFIKSVGSTNSHNKTATFVLNIIFSGIGIWSGILSLIIGFISFNLASGIIPGYNYYGGDAYTDLQHAISDACYNLHVLIDNINFGLGFLFIIAGLTLICAFSLNIIRVINKQKLR